MEGVLALLFFSFLLWEWPQFIREHEATSDSTPDSLTAAIRMARLKAGLPPWPTTEE